MNLHLFSTPGEQDIRFIVAASGQHVFRDNPILTMSDGAHNQVTGRKTHLVQGEAWIL